MSLTTSLLIGRSALTASQAGIQVAGDNLANAATPGYHRRVMSVVPASGSIDARGVYSGRGVNIESVTRRLDSAIESRLRDAVSNQQAAVIDHDLLSQLEALTNQLGTMSLDNRLGEFFGAFSELANNPNAFETRALVVEQGASLAGHMKNLRSDLLGLRAQVDTQITTSVERANQLIGEIAGMNRSLVNSELGQSENAALRDQRDVLLSELSELMDVSIVETRSGSVDVFVGSTPLITDTMARGVSLRQLGFEMQDAQLVVGNPAEVITPRSGRLGALLAQRDGSVNQTIQELDTLAASLVFEVNRIHSQGRPFPGMTEATGSRPLAAADWARALNDPDNATIAGLPFAPVNGSFDVVVTDTATGLAQTTRIQIDLDGLAGDGSAGFGDDTSLQDIVDAINAQVPNMTAEITANGRLRMQADSGFTFGFGQDSSGVLAVLGVNTFFDGVDAGSIAVRQELAANPGLLVTGVQEGSNEAALAIAGLREGGVASLEGRSMGEQWRRVTDRIAVDTSAGFTKRSATIQVRESLEAQRDAVSGVSIDEESINLITFQRQFQAAARLIATVDELTQTLIALV